MESFVSKCKMGVRKLRDASLRLLNVSSIEKYDDNRRSGIIMPRTNYWAKLSAEGEREQAQAITICDDLFSRLDTLFEDKPITIVEQYKKLKDYFITIIKRTSSGWDVPDTIESAMTALESNSDELEMLLERLAAFGESSVVIVPDTNALITNHRLETYGKQIGDIEAWTVIITSTVLSELDELKVKGNNNDFKDKVKKTIKFLKGLRKQGDVHEGVRIYGKAVLVKWLAVEPQMDKTLPWLDKDNNDDRLIASCWEIQIKNPSATVILMTEDINLQSKAQLAKLPFVEPQQAESN